MSVDKLISVGGKMLMDSNKKWFFKRNTFLDQPLSNGLVAAYMPQMQDLILDNGLITAVKNTAPNKLLSISAFVGTDTINVIGHGLLVDDYIIIDGTLPTGLTKNLYKVHTVVNSANIKVKDFALGTLITFTTGTGEILSTCKISKDIAHQTSLGNKLYTNSLNGFTTILATLLAESKYLNIRTNTSPIIGQTFYVVHKTLAIGNDGSPVIIGYRGRNTGGITAYKNGFNSGSAASYFRSGYAAPQLVAGTTYRYTNGTTTRYTTPVTSVPCNNSWQIAAIKTFGDYMGVDGLFINDNGTFNVTAGELAAVLIYTQPHNEYEIYQTIAYLKTKYGL